jgi:hypothetical protein
VQKKCPSITEVREIGCYKSDNEPTPANSSVFLIALSICFLESLKSDFQLLLNVIASLNNNSKNALYPTIGQWKGDPKRKAALIKFLDEHAKTENMAATDVFAMGKVMADPDTLNVIAKLID